MKKRRILAVAAAAVVVVLLAVGLWPRPQRLTLTGIVATDDVIVSSEIGGRLASLAVREGDTVTAGQVIATLQPPEYAADLAYYQGAAAQSQSQLGQAEADLRFQRAQTAAQIAQAEAGVAAARAQEQAAGADEENARLAFERARQLRANGTNSVSDFDQARTGEAATRAKAAAAQEQTRAAVSALAAARASADEVAARTEAVEAARHQGQAAEAQADKARVRLGYTQVTAPIAGVVDVRAARAGEVVNAGQAIATLINPDDLWVRVDLEETYVDRVRLGDHATIRLPSGDTRDGVLFYRAVDADFATQRDVSRSKRDIRTFQLRFRCDNRDRALVVGLTAYVTLSVAPR